jgi:DNA (cytosine-5)-methyltransferase 1
LFWEAKRIIEELRPPWFVLENVVGLLSSNKGRDFATILDAMDELRYGLAWRVFDSQYFRVPQRRRRVFIVGSFGKPCPPEILFGEEGMQKYSGEGQAARPSTSSRLAHGNSIEPKSLCVFERRWFERGIGSPPQQIAGCLTAGSASGDTSPCIAHTLHKGRERSKNPKNLAPALRGDHRLRKETHSNGVGEAAGLPAGLDTARYSALGNAVTVTVAEWIARRIAQQILGKNHLRLE